MCKLVSAIRLNGDPVRSRFDYRRHDRLDLLIPIWRVCLSRGNKHNAQHIVYMYICVVFHDVFCVFCVCGNATM